MATEVEMPPPRPVNEDLHRTAATPASLRYPPATTHPPSSQSGRVEREEPIKTYERQMKKAQWAARGVGTLHFFSKFLAICSLTWATAVILGAMVTNLHSFDYDMVVALLLLQAARLATASFFMRLVTRALIHLSQNPKEIRHGQDQQHLLAFLARLVSILLQVCLIFTGFICPIIGLGNIHVYEDPSTNVPNLQKSIYVFYYLIILNAGVSAVVVICSCIAYICLHDPLDESILRYYDQLLLNSLNSGIVQADNFDFFDFAYTMLGEDVARNVQPEALVKYYGKLIIDYLYLHRQGTDYLQIYLDAGNASVRQAAANMVGMWADPGWGVKKTNLKLPKELLTKLADRLGTGQVGWAAANSFGGLARRDPEFLKKTRTGSGEPVLERLAELVDGSSTRSLAIVRTLVLFYDKDLKGRHPEKGTLPDKVEAMVPHLKQLLEGNKLQRLRVLSAYLLHLLNKLDKSCIPHIESIRPNRDNYFFESEVEMLKFLYKMYNLGACPALPKVNEDHDKLSWSLDIKASVQEAAAMVSATSSPPTSLTTTPSIDDPSPAVK